MKNLLTRPAHALTVSVLVVFALVLSGCSFTSETVRDDTGTVTEANENASVFDMKEGDCFNDPGTDDDELETLPAVPCSQDHVYEVFEAYTIDEDEFPGDASVEATADSVCAAEFKTYVGTAYDDSVLDMYYLYPTAESWKGNDREITCLALDPEQPTSGTLKGAKR